MIADLCPRHSRRARTCRTSDQIVGPDAGHDANDDQAICRAERLLIAIDIQRIKIYAGKNLGGVGVLRARAQRAVDQWLTTQTVQGTGDEQPVKGWFDHTVAVDIQHALRDESLALPEPGENAVAACSTGTSGCCFPNSRDDAVAARSHRCRPGKGNVTDNCVGAAGHERRRLRHRRVSRTNAGNGNDRRVSASSANLVAPPGRGLHLQNTISVKVALMVLLVPSLMKVNTSTCVEEKRR